MRLIIAIFLAGVAGGFCTHRAVREGRNQELVDNVTVFSLVMTILSWLTTLLTGLVVLLRIVTPWNRSLGKILRGFERPNSIIGTFAAAIGVGAGVSVLLEKRTN